jgi:hypothetical protein
MWDWMGYLHNHAKHLSDPQGKIRLVKLPLHGSMPDTEHSIKHSNPSSCCPTRSTHDTCLFLIAFFLAFALAVDDNPLLLCCRLLPPRRSGHCGSLLIGAVQSLPIDQLVLQPVGTGSYADAGDGADDRAIIKLLGRAPHSILLLLGKFLKPWLTLQDLLACICFASVYLSTRPAPRHVVVHNLPLACVPWDADRDRKWTLDCVPRRCCLGVLWVSTCTEELPA